MAGFLRDSQINARLSSSKRLLVIDNDIEDLRNAGSIEYLIEFRLNKAAIIRFKFVQFTGGYNDKSIEQD